MRDRENDSSRRQSDSGVREYNKKRKRGKKTKKGKEKIKEIEKEHITRQVKESS